MISLSKAKKRILAKVGYNIEKPTIMKNPKHAYVVDVLGFKYCTVQYIFRFGTRVMNNHFILQISL
jgi:hypothetical protein